MDENENTVMYYDECLLNKGTGYLKLSQRTIVLCPTCFASLEEGNISGYPSGHVTVKGLVYDVIRLRYIRLCPADKSKHVHRLEKVLVLCRTNLKQNGS